MTGYHTGKKARLTALLLAAILILGLLPMVAGAESKYGCITKDGIFFRQSPSKDASYWEKLSDGWVMEILDTTTRGGAEWYKVQGGVPSAPDKTYDGYVMAEFFRELTAEETAKWLSNPVQGTISGGTTTGGGTATGGGSYVKTTIAGANLRSQASDAASSITSLGQGSVLAVISYTSGWYNVQYGDMVGYINGASVALMSQSEVDSYLGSAGAPSDYTISATVVTTGGTLTLRKSQSTSAQGLANIPHLTTLLVKDVGERWTKAYYNGLTGYVLTSYLNFGGVLPTATPETPSGSGTATVVTPLGGTLTLRKTQSTSAAALAYIPNMTVISYSDVGNKWTKVTYNGKTGYVLTSYLTFGAYVPTAAPTYNPGGSLTATVKTTGGTLTLRETESTGAKALTVIPNKTVLTILDRGSKWCLTTYNGYTGYVLTSYLVFGTADTSLSTYVYITASSTNVRNSPAGQTITQVKKGTVWQMTGSSQYKSNYVWFPIAPNGTNGWVRGDCAIQMTKEQADEYFATGKAPSATATPNPDAGKDSSYIFTLSTGLNIRAAASTGSTSIDKVGYGTVIKYTGKTTVGNTLWYKIDYLGVSCYVMGKYVRVMTNAEYDAYIGTLPTATPSAPPTAIPDLGQMSDLAYTVKANILVRKSGTPTATSILKLYTAPVYVTLTGNYNDVNATTRYYQVKVNGTTGWIRGDLIYIMTPEEKAAYEQGQVTPTSTPSSGYVKYNTLRLGSTGNEVTRMQNALVAGGYLSASEVSGSYLQTTKTAVIAFQRAKGLSTDGIAGQKTLATLYGTPIYDTPDVDATLYPVEKVDWYTGDIQKVWARGKTAVITDVKTGLSFNARRWAGAYHADVEPLTAADTAVMCKIYGVSNAQAISDKNLYQRRALWVTIGGRTFAASMYGVPHNYPDGDTIPNNNYNGQFCVHFVNSKTHGTKKVDADHQAAIQYAYDHAPSKK